MSSTVITGGFPGRYAQEVNPNPKCRGCLHYVDSAGRTGVCSIGSRPWLCGDGGAADIGYAPICNGAGAYLPDMTNHSARAREVDAQEVSDLYGVGSTRPVQFQQISLGEEHIHIIKSMVKRHVEMQQSTCRLCKSRGMIGTAPANVGPQVCTCDPIAARDVAKSLMAQLSNRERSRITFDDAVAFVYEVANAGFTMPINKAMEIPRGPLSEAAVHATGVAHTQGTKAAHIKARDAHARAAEFRGESPSERHAAHFHEQHVVYHSREIHKSDVEKGTKSATEVRSPTSTKTKTRTATEVRSPTSTSTDAYTQGNVTVTGGAGSGDTHVHLHGHQGKQSRRADKEAHEERSRGVAKRPEKMMHETGASRPDGEVDKGLSWKNETHSSVNVMHATAGHGNYQIQPSGSTRGPHEKHKLFYSPTIGQGRGQGQRLIGNHFSSQMDARTAAHAHHGKMQTSKSVGDAFTRLSKAVAEIEKADIQPHTANFKAPHGKYKVESNHSTGEHTVHYTPTNHEHAPAQSVRVESHEHAVKLAKVHAFVNDHGGEHTHATLHHDHVAVHEPQGGHDGGPVVHKVSSMKQARDHLGY